MAAPFSTLVDRGHRFVRHEKSGKSGFPRDAFNTPDGSLYVRLPGESRRDSSRIFFGRKEEERDEREERTQLPLLPILLAPGENIYILSLRGPGIVPRGILIRTISDIQYRSKAVLA